MSKNKHTPGPWHVVMSDNATPFIQHECGDDWTDIDDRTSRVCHMPAEIMESFNSLNNARLIAAAPELLEALQAARWSVTMSGTIEVLAKVDAAIAKATGGDV